MVLYSHETNYIVIDIVTPTEINRGVTAPRSNVPSNFYNTTDLPPLLHNLSACAVLVLFTFIASDTTKGLLLKYVRYGFPSSNMPKIR